MSKIIAIMNVVAWSGFWAFGYLAVTANSADTTQVMTAAVLAVIGGAIGMFSYLHLVRHSEVTGYAKPRNRVANNLRAQNGGVV